MSGGFQQDVYDEDQEKKILAQEVNQAIRTLVQAQKEVAGVGVEEVLLPEDGKPRDRPYSNPVHRRTVEREAPPPVQESYYSTQSRARMGGTFKLEFVPGYINFIPELSFLLVSCLLPTLAVSGKHVLTILLVGIITTYMLDYTNSKNLALLSVWLCVSAVWIGMYLTNVNVMRNTWLSTFIVLDLSLYLFILGLFATIQFKWLQVRSPELALASERVLLGLSPIICLPLLFSTCLSLVGSQLAPFGLAVVMIVLHRFFYVKRKSAFKEALTPEAKKEEIINGRLESGLFTLAMVTLPAVTEILINHKQDLSILHLLNILTLIALPLLYAFYDPKQVLWFAYSDPYDARDGPSTSHTRQMVLLIAYLVVLHWVIYRVAFGRFAHLLAGVTPPYNVILIAISAYCGSIVVYWAVQLVEQKQTGMDRAVKWTGVLFFSILAAVAFTYVAGMPRFVICCSALSAACLTSFCLEPSNVNNYILFALTTFIMLTWWMYKSFSFLNVDLAIFGGAEHISLPQLSVYILWLYLIQCVIFPLAMQNNTPAFYLSLLQQVVALSIVEHILYSQPENLYPFTCVLGTSMWGAFFTHKLFKNKKIEKTQASMLNGMYLAKFYLFCMVSTLPERDSDLYNHAYGPHALMVTFVTFGAGVTILLQLHYEKMEKKRRSTLVPVTNMYVMCCVIVAVLSKNSIVLSLGELTTGDAEMGYGRLWGLTMVYCGILQLPLNHVLPSSYRRARKISQACILVGAFIALLDPAIEGPATEANEIDLYESPVWGTALGLVSMVAVAVTLLGVVNLPENSGLRIGWWTVVSFGCGISFTALFIPYAGWSAYLYITLVFGLTVLCVDFTHYSVSAQADDSNTIWGFYTGTLVTLLAALLDAHWSIPESFDATLKFETANQKSNAILSLSIGINLILAALLKLKLTDRPALRSRDLSKADSIRAAAGDGSQFGLLGNICVIQAYVSLLILRSDFGDQGPGMPVLMSPLLLLMHDDGWLLNGIADPERLTRYLPPIVAALLVLAKEVAWNELPNLINKSPFSYAFQLTIYMLTLAIACAAIHDIYMDPKHRRSQGTSDTIPIVFCVILFMLAGTESIRITVGIALIASILPHFSDSAWTRKLSAVI
eukprot:TRINITY_DN26330_c0_g1_i1.p1 TRINITY_DN26330_c0_g1~~TRINITY_DN26330_c0_g1_i1.p1  ORF type:complete len:1121 (+),score=218.04 TRINITY_DN26330_c0_g1_i1:55-3417(+)